MAGFGCVGRGQATPADVDSLLTRPTYASGIQAFDAECRRCHEAGQIEPTHFDDAGWERFLPTHCRRVKIDEPTMRLILGYLTKYNEPEEERP